MSVTSAFTVDGYGLDEALEGINHSRTVIIWDADDQTHIKRLDSVTISYNRTTAVVVIDLGSESWSRCHGGNEIVTTAMSEEFALVTYA